MKRKALITFLIMLISLIAVGCEIEPKAASEETQGTEERQLDVIKCSIVLNKSSFSKDDSIPVTLKIENVSDKKIDLKTIPSFVLGGLWAPVNIKEGQTLHANTKMTMSLEKGDAISSKIDIAKIGWDQVTSSIWPTKNFYSLISPGKYKLFLNVEIDDKSGGSRIQSNEVEITIEDEKPGVSNEDKLYMTSNTAGIQLLKKISAKNKGENAIFSPVSLSTILAVLDNGAAGETREEINTIINPDQLSPEELNKKYCNTISRLTNLGYKENGNKTTLIELVNSLWIQEKLRVKDSFLKASNTYYGAEAYNVDFANDSTISAMNRWIEDKTHGRIQNYITGFNPPPAMVAFNSLYFNGKWQRPFDKSKTQKEDFYLNNGNTARVDMMNDERRIIYYEDNQIQAGIFNYYGCNMLVILPKGDIGEYVRSLNYTGIQKAYSNSENMKVKIKFPKFNFKQKNTLVSHLETMGLESAFDSRNADFTGIADRSEDFNLYVSDISQECFISVDEEGTEAAALTSVILAGSAMPKENTPPEFYLNKPFIFVISDDQTGMILFLGKVENPLD